MSVTCESRLENRHASTSRAGGTRRRRFETPLFPPFLCAVAAVTRQRQEDQTEWQHGAMARNTHARARACACRPRNGSKSAGAGRPQIALIFFDKSCVWPNVRVTGRTRSSKVSSLRPRSRPLDAGEGEVGGRLRWHVKRLHDVGEAFLFMRPASVPLRSMRRRSAGWVDADRVRERAEEAPPFGTVGGRWDRQRLQYGCNTAAIHYWAAVSTCYAPGLGLGACARCGG